ncbi:MAG: sigma-70 family RNA polymerase sigma factor [Ideonella sp.]
MPSANLFARSRTSVHPAIARAAAAASGVAAEPTADAAIAVSWPEMISHRSYLIRFAQRKLHDPVLAEDVVHDVFEAVISGRASFAGRAALRSWLTAILKHKIIDLVRQRAHFDAFETDDGSDESGANLVECPHARPDEVAEQREALQHTLARIDNLPPGLRDVMRLRILFDQPTEEVCASLSISEENLFVRLHRARKQLLS